MQRIGVIAYVRLRTADLCKQLAFPRIFIIRIQCIDTDLIGLIGFISKDAGSRQVVRLLEQVRERYGRSKNIWAYTGYIYDRDLVPGAYGLYVIDENGTVVYGLFGQVWTNIDRLYFASDSMFGLRRDGTVAVDQEASQWDDRIARVGEWTHIKELGFDITGIARYVPVGLREDGTVCAITEYEDGEPYGWWDFTGWRDVQKLFSGTDCTVGVRSDGSVLVTGGEFGALDFQDEIARWKDIRAIYFAVGEFTDHVVGLKTDGTLVAAGDNSLGQCNVTG